MVKRQTGQSARVRPVSVPSGCGRLDFFPPARARTESLLGAVLGAGKAEGHASRHGLIATDVDICFRRFSRIAGGRWRRLRRCWLEPP